MSPDEWDELGWDIQKAYLDGLELDGTLSWDGGEGDLPVTRREGVSTGTDVIDLTAMRQELEDARRQGR